MSEILIQTLVKYIIETKTSMSAKLGDPLTVSVTTQVGDTNMWVEPAPVDFKSNRALWFPQAPVYLQQFIQEGDEQITIKPCSTIIPEGSLVYPDSHVSINDWSILDYTWLDAPYLVIGSAYRVSSSREGGNVIPTWLIPIEPHTAWEVQDVALAELNELIDEIVNAFNEFLLYPVLPAVKYVSFVMEEEPFFREHPNTAPDIPGLPQYAGQRIGLVFEDYEETYTELDKVAFLEQF